MTAKRIKLVCLLTAIGADILSPWHLGPAMVILAAAGATWAIVTTFEEDGDE